ncbi:epoxyqueuosine reductase [Methanobrevibacter filiformis]|uniref:Epoxyqueuosine reductase n=1 Tax=Methanobrevibacter filiformis TaxID=55758 RepID=A0A165ZNZ8_9EURY|nr:epoxyqueuosine reductase [Methanobrevibacter filiformis]KZX10969.1 epoxyqueuosine reductase [Methanobrevibacter filiformis]
MYTKEELSKILKSMAIALGASDVGIATIETLKGGPKSTELNSALDGAKSAIVFAVPFNQDLIEPFLAKEDFDLNENKIKTTTFAGGISLELAGFLNQMDYNAVPVAPNFIYRKDTPNGIRDRKPIVSHKYLAARAGVGFFGHSGHILTKDNGSAIALSSVVTDAELKATEPISKSENYCDECMLCKAGCIPGYISKAKTKVKIGGFDFEYQNPKSHWRCILVCGGATGLHPSKKYSTWSPGRFDIPQEDIEFEALREKAMPAYVKRPKKDPVFYHPGVPEHKMQYTCSTCQLICHPDKSVRKHRYKLFKNSEVIFEDKLGNRKRVSPDEAEEIIKNMSETQKKLYT